MKLESVDKFSNNPQISVFMNIHPLGAELFYAQGQTDRLTANSRSSQFCERA